jgi:anti-anti-sigma regulatory factor
MGALMAKAKKATMKPLPESMDIASAQELFKTFTGYTKKPADITLDASKVERITTPAIQLILALAKTLEADKHSLSIASPSEQFVAAFEDLGLQDEITAGSV